MTSLEKISRANRWRIRTGILASQDQAGWNGDFLVPLDGDMWRVRISDGMGWRHLSVSNAQRKVLPPWQIMCRLRDLFFADDEWVVQYHPPKEDYVDLHPYVLHLWSSLDEKFPVPNPCLV